MEGRKPVGPGVPAGSRHGVIDLYLEDVPAQRNCFKTEDFTTRSVGAVREPPEFRALLGGCLKSVSRARVTWAGRVDWLGSTASDRLVLPGVVHLAFGFISWI
jgi:hypothetical protein